MVFRTQLCTNGGNSHTDMVAPSLSTLYISGNNLSNGSKGKGITPNNKTLSMLSVSSPVFRASFCIIRTLFKLAFCTFLATSLRNPEDASIAIIHPWSPTICAAGMVKKPVPHPTSRIVCPGCISAILNVFTGFINHFLTLLPISNPAGLKNRFNSFELPKSSVFMIVHHEA